MEVKFLGKGKNKAKIELVGETHTFANAIRHELWETGKVDNAAYQKPHPSMGNPVLVVESKSDDPIDIVKKACKRLISRTESLKSEFSKAVK